MSKNTIDIIKDNLEIIDHSASDIQLQYLCDFHTKKELEFLKEITSYEATGKILSKYHFSNPDMAKLLDYKGSTKISQSLGRLFPKMDFSSLNNTLNCYSYSLNPQDICNSLNNKGYFVCPDLIPDNIIQNIKDKISGKLYTQRDLDKLYRIYDESDLHYLEDNTSSIFDTQDVIKIPEVQDLLMDSKLLKAVELFLGSQPVHMGASIWWSTNNIENEISFNRNAQLYHQDKDSIKFLKIFVYLTDVTDENGPHSYIEGTNVNYKTALDNNYYFGKRFNDKYLSQFYDKSLFKNFTGKKGTMILEDTSGFHKGSHVLKGHRQILQLLFSTTTYPSSDQFFSYSGLTEKYKKFLSENSRFSLNYNNSKHKRDLLYKKMNLFKKKIAPRRLMRDLSTFFGIYLKLRSLKRRLLK